MDRPGHRRKKGTCKYRILVGGVLQNPCHQRYPIDKLCQRMGLVCETARYTRIGHFVHSVAQPHIFNSHGLIFVERTFICSWNAALKATAAYLQPNSLPAMSQYNHYSSAYSPQYQSPRNNHNRNHNRNHNHDRNHNLWGDSPNSPDPFASPGAVDRIAEASDLFEAFAEGAGTFFDSLPRLGSPRPQDPLPLPHSSSRRQQHQSRPTRLSPTLPSFRLSSSPDPFDPFLDSDPLDRHDLAQTARDTRESSVVDLTASPQAGTTSNTMPPRKRKAETPGEGRASKVTRASVSRSSRSTPAMQPKMETPEMVDLVDIDDDEKYEDFKAKQQAALIKQQQLDEANKPAKLAEFQCIICMDNPTDLTVTHCGMYMCLLMSELC